MPPVRSEHRAKVHVQRPWRIGNTDWNSSKCRSISRCYSILTSSKWSLWLTWGFFESLCDDLYQLFYMWFVEVGIPSNLSFLANKKIIYLFSGEGRADPPIPPNFHKNKKGRNNHASWYRHSYIHFANSNPWQHNLSCIQKPIFLQEKHKVFYEL